MFDEEFIDLFKQDLLDELDVMAAKLNEQELFDFRRLDFVF